MADDPIRRAARGGLVRVNPGEVVGMPHLDPAHDELLTMREVAALCAVDYDTVVKWIQCGALAYVEVGPTRIKRVRRSVAEAQIRQPAPSRSSR